MIATTESGLQTDPFHSLEEVSQRALAAYDVALQAPLDVIEQRGSSVTVVVRRVNAAARRLLPRLLTA
jgi:hypothetical protein